MTTMTLIIPADIPAQELLQFMRCESMVLQDHGPGRLRTIAQVDDDFAVIDLCRFAARHGCLLWGTAGGTVIELRRGIVKRVQPVQTNTNVLRFPHYRHQYRGADLGGDCA